MVLRPGPALLPLSLMLVRSLAYAADGAEDVEVRGSRAGGFTSQARIEEMPREITDTSSLLEPLPGVHVRRLGADDSFATLSVRGTSSSQVAIYLAGVPLTGGADPSLDLAALPLWPSARARVFRSFAPASLGRGSLGGTLALDPPSPRGPPRTEAWVAVGSFGARRVRVADVRAVGDDLRVASALSASRSDDDFTYLDPADHATAVRENAGHAAASGLLSVGMPLRFGNRNGALTITTLAQARRQELPGAIPRPTPAQSLSSNRLLLALELTNEVASSAVGSIRAWGRREGLSLRDDPDEARATGSAWSTGDAIVAAGGSMGVATRAPKTRVEARIDGSGERFAPGTWLGVPSPASARRTSVGAALDADLRASANLLLSASGRGDAWFDASDAGSAATEARPSAHVGGELALGAVTVASHAGILSRPPSFVERYGNRGAFLGDENLKPESAFTADLGARTRTRLGDVRVDAELVGFATWAEDLITYVRAGAFGRSRATNIGRARIAGAEAFLRAKAWKLDLRVADTLLATANLSTCTGVFECERPSLPGRPTNEVVADLSYSFGATRIRYGVDAVSGIQADLTGSVLLPARVLHNVGMYFTVPGATGLSTSFEVRNLFDLRTGEVPSVLGGTDRRPIGDLYDYPLPGRRFLLTVRWTGLQ